jgi:glutathione S-transferase
VEVRLFAIPASHPSITAMLMLEHKGIPFKRVDMPPGISKGLLRGLGFPGTTVPAIKLDGRHIQGSRQIASTLDQLRPDPPLFPTSPVRRALVEEAERFGDEDLQDPIRQILWTALKRDPRHLRSYLEGAKLGVPVSLAAGTVRVLVALSSRRERADDQGLCRVLTKLPALLDRVDAWIGQGILDGAQLNAADFQIAPSLRLAMTLDDLRPAIEPRPSGELAKRVVPQYPGHIPPILPATWLDPLRPLATHGSRVHSPAP